MFRIPGSGGLLIGSWDLHQDTPKIQKLRYGEFPNVSMSALQTMESCISSAHLVESGPTRETFLVKWYKKLKKSTTSGRLITETYHLIVFKLDDQGNAVPTKDIGDLCIFLSDSEPFCVLASSFPDVLRPNELVTYAINEHFDFCLTESLVKTKYSDPDIRAPYHIPPQYID
ncbi:unnamed protein product [Microthlaspi erraticum]|uniref:KIB1-4 beta-propeller domain-containing protein n=1 Tax=Microthlaspi erraticum TaxID=1685480 RepID=A0A6D2K4P9_9BRAS|nr:unnamed protein product [Microthlaspi erraticum]